jgi:hypothetical protein
MPHGDPIASTTRQRDGRASVATPTVGSAIVRGAFSGFLVDSAHRQNWRPQSPAGGSPDPTSVLVWEPFANILGRFTALAGARHLPLGNLVAERRTNGEWIHRQHPTASAVADRSCGLARWIMRQRGPHDRVAGSPRYLCNATSPTHRHGQDWRCAGAALSGHMGQGSSCN